jgi:hypothetical protein
MEPSQFPGGAPETPPDLPLDCQHSGGVLVVAMAPINEKVHPAELKPFASRGRLFPHFKKGGNHEARTDRHG